jgi:hypothetical protein
MDSITVQVLIVVIGLISTLVTLWVNRKKADADTSKINVETSISLIAPLRKKIEELEGENKLLGEQIGSISDQFAVETEQLRAENRTLHEQNVRLEDRVKRLEAQVISLGHRPVEAR